MPSGWCVPAAQWVSAGRFMTFMGGVLVYTTGLTNDTSAADYSPAGAQCEQIMRNWINVKTLVEDKSAWDLPLTKAVWRVYFRERRASKACRRVELEVTLEVGGSKLGVRSRTIRRAASISKWVDLDVTAALQSVWPLHANTSEVIIQTHLRCQACTGRRRNLAFGMVDLRMVAPSERESRKDFQPALALHLRNEASWKSLMDSLELEQARGRTKRSVEDVKKLQASHCRKENYTVQFENIPYLRDVVVLPRSYDIGRCVGLCRYDIDHKDRPKHFITNHGVVMSLLQLNPRGWPGSQEPNVTCVPITYKPVQFIIQRTSAVESVVYRDFAVTECGCR